MYLFVTDSPATVKMRIRHYFNQLTGVPDTQQQLTAYDSKHNTLPRQSRLVIH